MLHCKVLQRVTHYCYYHHHHRRRRRHYHHHRHQHYCYCNFYFIFLRPCYFDFLKILKLHTTRRTHLDALFLICVYSGLNCWLSVLAVTGIRVLSGNFRTSSLFCVACKNSPSARCFSAANLVFKGAYICTKSSGSLKETLN